jgi:hypothetical protein
MVVHINSFLRPRRCIVFCLFLVTFWASLGDKERAAGTYEQATTENRTAVAPVSPISVVSGRIAVISPIESLLPREAASNRNSMFEKIAIRGILWFHRRSGIDLAAHPLVVPGIGFVCLGFGLWLLFWKNHSRLYPVMAVVGALGIAMGVAAGVEVYQVYEIQEMDLRDIPDVLQSYIDIFAGRGLDFEIVTDWEGFAQMWAREVSAGRLPYSVIAWTSELMGDADINSWIRRYSYLPVLHVGLGPALPAVLRDTVFTDPDAWLDWDEKSPKRITEAGAQANRDTHWRSREQTDTIVRAEIAPELNGKERGWAQAARVLYGKKYSSNKDLMAFEEQLSMEMARLPSAFASARLQQAGVLRLDDPGASQSAYLNSWRYPTLTYDQWNKIEQILERQNARMSVSLVSGWVDDGDGERGALWIRGCPVTNRKPGQIYPSRWVRFRDKRTGWWYDPEQEANFFQTNPAMLDFEVHGYTHLAPDIDAWLKAADRYQNEDWYREFLIAYTRPFRQQPARVQNAILEMGLKAYRSLFNFPPSTLIPPGNRTSFDTVELARIQNYRLVSEKYLNILGRKGSFASRMIELTDLGDEKSVAGTFPVILCLHDRDIVLNSPEWFQWQLEEWKQRGIGRFITLRELAVRLTMVPETEYNKDRGLLEVKLSTDELDLEHLRRALAGKLDFWIQLPQGCAAEPSGDLVVKTGPDDRNRVLVEWHLGNYDPSRPMRVSELPLKCDGVGVKAPQFSFMRLEGADPVPRRGF